MWNKRRHTHTHTNHVLCDSIYMKFKIEKVVHAKKLSLPLGLMLWGQIQSRFLGIHNIHLSFSSSYTGVILLLKFVELFTQISILHSMRFIPQFKQKTEREAAGEFFHSWKT